MSKKINQIGEGLKYLNRILEPEKVIETYNEFNNNYDKKHKQERKEAYEKEKPTEWYDKKNNEWIEFCKTYKK